MSEERSDTSQEEITDLPEVITELSNEYVDLVIQADSSSGSAEEEIEDLRDELEYWEDELDDLKEEDELYSIAIEERNSLEQRIDEHDQKEKRREQVRRQLIERIASDFVAREEWIEPPVIKAVTCELLGEVREEILVDEHQVPTDELDNKILFSISKNIRAVAGDKLGRDDRISNLWESIEGTRQYPIVEVLSDSTEALGPSDIAKAIQDEDRDRRHIGDAIGKMRDKQYHPYSKVDGGYTLSFIGEYVWQEYGPDNDVELDEEQTGTEKNPSADSDLTNF
ncbi:hypothetical protein ACFQDG_01915 [Natronoarchaeum mannanilyticum]|uniref:Uncharacterized protein n=1 Tax=Natronoarchaeum mannanilyticum TaxID=926360 RepID=A0AAV3TAS2_9EURY